MSEIIALNSLNDLLSALAVLCIVIAVGMVIRRVIIIHLRRFVSSTENKFDDLSVLALETLGFRFYLILAVFISLFIAIELPNEYEAIIVPAFAVFISIYVIFILTRTVDFLANLLLTKLKDKQKDWVTLIPSIKLLVKIILVVFVGIFTLSNIGIDVTALLAGVGIGGLAVAFASQKILADLFSAFVIFFDKPFSVGDVIVTDDISGRVERVGLKTTHVRAISGELIIVSNESLVNTIVRNLESRPFRRIKTTIPIAYGESRDELNKASEIIKKAIQGHKKTEFSYTSISHFGERALMFETVYKVVDSTFNESMDIRHQIHIEILDKLQKAGVDLGYPIEISLRKSK